MHARLAALALVAAVPRLAAAQHAAHDGAADRAADRDVGAGAHAMPPGPLGIPMSRDASGTSWQPDATPMHAIHIRAGGWLLMFHGTIFAGYDVQGSDRGDDKLFSANWIMAMAQRPLLGGELSLRGMFSLDPITMGKRGYPLLLQSGESVEGEPLVDRQHPHDLFMELAARYRLPLGDSVALELYGGPVGEPALGPVAFPHRLSAAADPLAPLGHHWQDSTHIAFGVVTAGLMTRMLKLEASWFNGREPDEHRYDFDLRSFDSVSTRLSLNPTPAWSAQVSYGYLETPEALEPEVSIDRVTASVLHVGRPDFAKSWATSAVWGRNIPSEGEPSDAVHLESSLSMHRAGTVFGRGEFARKSGHELALPEPMEHDIFPIGSLTLGYLYDLGTFAKLEPGVGVRATVNVIGDDLAELYGTNTPLGGMVFVRLAVAAAHEDAAAVHEGATTAH